MGGSDAGGGLLMGADMHGRLLALTDDAIGQWARRYKAPYTSSTQAHVVESIIEDRIVTACGRQMREHMPAGTLRFADAPIIGDLDVYGKLMPGWCGVCARLAAADVLAYGAARAAQAAEVMDRWNAM